MDRDEYKNKALEDLDKSAAIDKTKTVYKELPESLRNDLDIARSAVKVEPEVFFSLPNQLQQNPVLQDIALSNLGPALCGMSADIRNDPSSVSKAMAHTPQIIVCASNAIRNDKDFVLNEVRKHGETYRALSDVLKSDEQIAIAAVRSKPDVISDVPDNIRDNVRSIVKNEMSGSHQAMCMALSVLSLDRCSDIRALSTPPQTESDQTPRR